MATLNEEEVKRLLPFLKSPFFNSNPSIIKLYRILRKYHPDFSSRLLSKELLFEKIFPGRKFDYNKMHNLFSDFTRLLEKYLINIELQKSKAAEKKLLVQSYMNRDGAYHLFEKEVSLLDRQLEDSPYRDETYFYEKEWLNLKIFSHHGTGKRMRTNDSFEKAIQFYSGYEKLKKIKLECAQHSVESITKSQSDIQQIEVDSAVFNLYRKLSQTQKSPDDVNILTQMIEEFVSSIQKIRLNDRNNIIKLLQNYCARLINMGNEEVGKISLSLYQVGLENECLIVNGKLTETTFQNIIGTAIYCGQLEWAKSFIEKYNSNLDEKIKEDAMNIGLAHWHFAKGLYHETIQILQWNFKDSQNQFKAKSILVRTWFELFLLDRSYFEMLSMQLEAFEKFTRRNKKIQPRLAEAYLHFIMFTKKIANAIIEGKKKAALKVEIKKQPTLALKSWLLEKAS